MPIQTNILKVAARKKNSQLLNLAMAAILWEEGNLYGLSENEEEPLKRTRREKMSYLEVAGSDTEEEDIARRRKHT
ncbi:unnamed protein product [Nezara viridula]|uniref:Uncharacterized protein n=1 Tax=Nezara viridula TaxID=85310 RepID=A0A9P0H4A8_NEZVI|nr:unnamed protein product [Nezara viridula]